MTSLLGLAILAAALSGQALGFVPVGGRDSTHTTITKEAVLKKVMETCRAVAEVNNYEFSPTGESPEEIVQACLGPTATGDVSGAKFHAALQEINMQHGRVDQDFEDSAPHHFNSEAFIEGRRLISEGMIAIKASVGKENFKAARETLGRILHTLQDFYSHSNWVELGYTEPYLQLIRPELLIENIADLNTPTCRDCTTESCPDPILPSVLSNQKLTSGYMGISSSFKPSGKCSHGGQSDLTSDKHPRGGIHKDGPRGGNRYYYEAAVKVATAASLQLLDDIRLAVEDKPFLRMMGIARSSGVCFVVDTTGSMSDDIEAAKATMYDIINSKKGTQDEPSEYIMVPFNDPEFGPPFKTPDAEIMIEEISKIKVDGGGDAPEMCYHGIQLALTTAPDYSNIYVFTDAEAKDGDLQDALIALTGRTKSSVWFLQTNGGRRRRRSTSGGTFEDYKKLTLASGGQVIQVSKAQLPQATAIILDTSTSALVTVLQQARNPGKPDTFPFILDASLKKITIYITGSSLSFTLTNPDGVSQSSSQTSGPLATVSTVGNLWRTTLNADRVTGAWQISINSNSPYELKVTGQSTISFIYDFVEKFEGSHPGYAILTGRPQAGQPATLMLPVMGRAGPISIKVKEVSLISVSNSATVATGTTSDMGDGSFLVTVSSVPEGEFMILVKGTDEVSNTDFQRQSTTQMSVSKVNIKATVSSCMEPGKPFALSFGVLTDGTGGDYKIDARNDREFTMNYPSELTLTPGEHNNASLTITAPPETPSGTDVTLTLEASRGVDSNYAVLRLCVLEKITDFFPPLCEIINITNTCPEPSHCADYEWEVIANLTDGNGTGIASVNLNRGNGTLTKIIDSDPAHYRYNASCCAEVVEIVAVDKIGNVGKCSLDLALRSDATMAKKALQDMYNILVQATEQLNSSYNTLLNEKQELEKNYSAVQAERDQLQLEVTKLNVKIRVKRCPLGWRSFQFSCYYTSESKKNWKNSRDFCLNKGADLAIITSQEEMNFINGLYSSDKEVWIGLTDDGMEGHFRWVDGTPLNQTATFWGRGQPNNYNGQNQDCVEFWHRATGHGEWNDENCTYEQYWICEL